MGNFGELQKKIQTTEQKFEGRLSYKEAIRLESISRSLQAFDQQLKDSCYLQQQPDLYHAIKKRMADADKAHEAHMRALALKRKKRNEELSEILAVLGYFTVGAGALSIVVMLILFV